MLLNLTETELQQMRAVILDSDGAEALKLLKKFIKRLEQQQQAGMKSHLYG